MELQILKPYRIELAQTLNQHWYNVWTTKKFIGTFPSSTTILNAYPQSPQLTQWIAEKGWHESQRLKSEAGIRGTNVHTAVEDLLKGMLVSAQDYSLEEGHKINAFFLWYNAFKPKILAMELPVFSKKYGYAGRVDCIAELDGQIYVLDWKTSSSIHNHFWLQFASYAQAIEEMTNLKIDNVAGLQLGARNEKTYRFSIEPDWRPMVKTFLSVKNTWEYEHGKGASEAPVINLPKEWKL